MNDPTGGRRTSLFGQLALRLATHPENIATEALCYILRTAPAARQVLTELAEAAGAELSVSDRLSYDTQLGRGEYGIPDLVGWRSDGSLALLVEAKFGAGLTKNQPVQYLNSLSESAPSVVLMLVPHARLRSVWHRCQQRCMKQRGTFQEVDADIRLFARAAVGKHHLGIVSWRRLMKDLEEALSAGDDPQTFADLQQLQGLVDQMEEEVFIPFTNDDLKPERGRKHFQLVRLVDKVTECLVNEGPASRNASQKTGRLGSYGRTFELHGSDCFLVVTPRLWFRAAQPGIQTPLWLVVSDPRSKSAARVRRALAELEDLDPPRLYDYSPEEAHIPLLIPPGQEEDEVIRSLVEQITGLTTGLTQTD